MDWAEARLGDSSTLRVPTTEEVGVILRPYRPDVLRWHAYHMYEDGQAPVLLRTHYSTQNWERAQHHAPMAEWADSEMYDNESWWGALDNEEYFNFGPDWRRIYDILPEANNPISWGNDFNGMATRGRSPDFADDKLRPRLKTDIAKAKEENPTEWCDKRDTVIENIGKDLQCNAANTYLLIADEQALNFNELRLLYLDPFRNIIREGRLSSEWEDIGGVMNSWRNFEITHLPTVIGDKYRVNGELGKDLYQLTEEDLADPKQTD